jgi:hypothetical protein
MIGYAFKVQPFQQLHKVQRVYLYIIRNKKKEERQTYNFPPLRFAPLSTPLPDAALDTGVDNDCGSTPPSVAIALWILTSGATDDPESTEVGKGVLRDGVDVGDADERLMRLEVGTAGPFRQLVSS